MSGAVTLADAVCEPGSPSEPPEPCQRYAIAVSTSGILKVQVSTAGPYGFTLGIGLVRRFGNTVSARVRAGSIYEISVALHGRIENIPSQTFELTTTLEPQ